MSRRSALGCVHLAALLFGFAALFGKWLTLPAASIVFGRASIASAALGIFMILRRERPARPDWRMLVGGAILALHWVAFFIAIQVSTVAIGLLGYASFPLFVVVLETFVLRRRIERLSIVAAMLVALGLALLVPVQEAVPARVEGLAWGVLSGLCFALLTVGNRWLAPRASAGAIAFWQNGFAALCVLPWVALSVTDITPENAAGILVLGIVCTALAHTLFILSLRVLAAQTAGVIAALEPVYGIALAVLFLGEVPDARTIAGAVLIVGATLLVTLRDAL